MIVGFVCREIITLAYLVLLPCMDLVKQKYKDGQVDALPLKLYLFQPRLTRKKEIFLFNKLDNNVLNACQK